MIVDEVRLAAEAGDTQDAGHGALVKLQNGPDEQDLGVAPKSGGARAAKRAGRSGMTVSLGGNSASPRHRSLCRPSLPHHPPENGQSRA
jgi:hypothetical protein